MRLSFRNGFFAGVILALVFAVWFWQLWQPARQVELHSEHLIAALQSKNWDGLGVFLDDSYHDQWNQDRALVSSRLREVLRYARNLRLTSGSAVVIAGDGQADWTARVTIDADSNEIADLVKSRVNKLDAPFKLHWQQKSWKPWDWKLVRVTNGGLDLSDANY